MNHRFINADAYAYTGQGFTGTNMFAYCLNNPAVYVDSTGTKASLHMMSILCDAPAGDIYDIINYPSQASKQMRNEVQALWASDEYSSATWEGLTVDEKMCTIQSFYGDVSSILGVTDHDLYVVRGLDSSIKGYHQGDSVNLNVLGIVDHQILVVIAHELYHAYQEDVVKGVIKHNEPRATVDAWRQSFLDYSPTPPGGYGAYYNQAVEISAFWFSESALDESYYNGQWFGYYYCS